MVAPESRDAIEALGRTIVKRPAKKQPDVRPAATSSRTGDVWIYAALLAAVAAIYARALSFDFVNFGDPAENPHAIAGFTRDGLAWALSTLRGGWIPLTRLSQLADCQIFGLNAGMHHLVNVLIHAATSLLLFAVLKRATGARWASAFVAFVFAVHPLQVETVAWVGQRGVLLAGLFSVLAILGYVRSDRRMTIAMFVCAVLSHPAAAALPLLLVVLDVWPLGRFSRASVMEKIPLTAISAAAAIAMLVGHGAGHPNTVVRAAMDVWKVIVPVKLGIFDPSAIVPAWQWAGAAVAMLAVTAVAWIGARSRPELAVGWLWFVAGLAPFTGNVYFSIIGLAILIAWGFSGLPGRVRGAIAIAACAVWSGVSWIEAGYWQNSATLFQHAIESGGGAFAYDRLGESFERDGRLTEAVANFDAAAKLRPDDAAIEADLGSAIAALGKDRAAMPVLQRAVQLGPDAARAHEALGSAHLRAGRKEQAAAEFRKALAIEPGRIEAEAGLGRSLSGQDAAPHLQIALTYFTDRVRLLPDDGSAHLELGKIYAAMGKADDSIVEFSSAVRLSPDNADAHTALGLAFEGRQRMDDAFGELASAVRLRPEDPRAAFRLGELLMKLGRPLEGMQRLERVVKLDPDLPGAREAFDAARKRVYGN